MRTPLEIVGGGLAGLALGGALRRAGVPVTLYEAGAYPRHRVCGEFITGLSPRTIGRLGLGPVLEDALRHHAVAWHRGDRLVRIQPLPSPALGLSRHALDARLADAFVAAGGDLRTQTRLSDPAAPPGRVFATGRRRGVSDWLGLKLHALGLTTACDLELHLGDDAYVGLSAVEGGRVNVCGLFRRRKLESGRDAAVLLAYLRAAGLAGLAGRLERAELDPDSFCAVAAVGFDRHVPDLGRVCLGDACAMIPPFTGNGMAMAFQSAEAAYGPLIEYAAGEATWSQAAAAIHRALRRRFRLRLASAGALHPHLLRRPGQRWLTALTQARLLPLTPLYSILH